MALSASRRDVGLGLAAALPLAWSRSALALNPMVDSGKKGKRGGYDDYEEPAAYLSEPTAEFKEAEKARAVFRQKQAAYKAFEANQQHDSSGIQQANTLALITANLC